MALERHTRHLRISMTLACVVLHLATARGYGYFRGELYALACSSRLAWGYVDHPPLSIALLRVVRSLLGDSLPALRLLPALAGGAAVYLTGTLCRRMGGGAQAQLLAMLSMLVAPVFLFQRHVYGPAVFDTLLATLAAAVLARLFVTGERFLWIVLGVVLGVGLLNGLGMLLLGFGLAIGLRFSRHRGWYMTPWPWAAGAISFALFAAHLVWQVRHEWPTLRLLGNLAVARTLAGSREPFLVRLLVDLNPVSFVVWGAGLIVLLLPGKGDRFRPFAWVYLTVLALLSAFPAGQAGSLAPACPPLLAAGGIALERWSRLPGRRFLVPATVTLVALGGLVLAPMALPVLPIDAYLRYSELPGVRLATLPRRYADMLGWEEIVVALARARDSLPAAERARTEIYVDDYGEAGAVERFGPSHGIPGAWCAHNNYWFWGPGPAAGDALIVLGGRGIDLESHCASVEELGREGERRIRLCRGLHPPLAELWPGLRHFD